MKKQGKLRNKLMSLFIAVAVVCSLASFLQTSQSIFNTNAYEKALEQYGFAQGEIARAMLSLTDTRTCLRDMISARTDQDFQQRKKSLMDARDEYAVHLEQIHHSVSDDEEVAILTQLENEARGFFTTQDRWVEQLENTSNRETLRAALNTEVDALYDTLHATHEVLLNCKTTLGSERAEYLHTIGSRAMIASGVILCIGVVMTVLFVNYLSRRIIKPVGELVKAADQLGNGDLQIDLDINTNDELSQLGIAFNAMGNKFHAIISDVEHTLARMSDGDFTVASTIPAYYVGQFKGLLQAQSDLSSHLSGTLRRIHIASESVSTGSEQVAAGAHTLSQGATEQAAAVQQLASALEMINQQVQQAGAYANEASDKTASAGARMSECSVHMQNMVGAMDEISNTSEEIGKIIKTIEDIAFQTNILALNAAVEAARAGTAGKGFAVVADEVRALAAKSAEASQNSSALIQASMLAVQNGAKIATETAKQLNNVVADAQEVSDMVMNIAAASQRQAESVAQVTTGIDQISAVVQTNSATAEQSATASQELSEQSAELKALVQQFKLSL